MTKSPCIITIMETCKNCGVEIFDNYKKLPNGNLYHDSCWTCSNCNAKLESQYAITDTGILCMSCHEGCWQCGKLIVCGSPLVKELGHRYHPECFSCDDCGAQLTKYFVRNSEVVCRDCLLGCKACTKPIKSKFVRLEGDRYHPECFKCGKCDSVLLGAFKTRNQVVFCTSCV